jgi:hypothetical protein
MNIFGPVLGAILAAAAAIAVVVWFRTGVEHEQRRVCSRSQPWELP